MTSKSNLDQKELLARAGIGMANISLPPLGHLQALILKALAELGREASGYGVLHRLKAEVNVWLDHAQVYGSISKLLSAEMIELVDSRKENRRGPPLKIYAVTPKGVTALRETAEHYKAVAAMLGSVLEEDWNEKRQKR